MRREIEEASQGALEVLLHNREGPYDGLPRTAGWGYPEPYTRDLMISLLGIAVSDHPLLLSSIRRSLETLAKNQTEHGHIPSLVHDPDDVGASDTTPLFLLALGIFRKVSEESEFLEASAQKALGWMAHQSPIDRYLVAQQPTSDWRDEQWVMGYGLYVNTLVYSYLRLFGQHAQADRLQDAMKHFTITGDVIHRHVHEGLVVPDKPYYALWSYKLYSSERFDLLGNSLAILSGIATRARANAMIDWIEAECRSMKQKGLLALDLPPNFF
ncbi:MAG: amylo-alpha-1,6-glucosidase, partial [Bacteroidota bacterium]